MCSEIESFLLELQKHFVDSAFWGWYGGALKGLVLTADAGYNYTGAHFRVFDPDANNFYMKPKVVGYFEVSEFPGAGCLAFVFHNVYIEPDYRGKKIGTALLAVREAAAQKFGVKLLVATVRDNNEAEKHLLLKHKWEMYLSVPSKNAGVNVQLFAKKL